VVKPYSREYIAKKLREAQLIIEIGQLIIRGKQMKIKVSKRLIQELAFYQQDFQLEDRARVVEYEHKVGFIARNNPDMKLALNPLAFNYRDSLFTLSLRPILGVH